MQPYGETPRTFEVKSWELAALWGEAVVVAAGVLTATALGGIKIGWRLVPWPSSVWMGLGFALMGLAFYPVLSIWARNVYGKRLSFYKLAAASLAGGALGGLIYAWLAR